MKRAILTLLCHWLGHRWTRWAGYRQLLHPVPGQCVEVPAEALIATIHGVYVVQGRIYCKRCRYVVRGT